MLSLVVRKRTLALAALGVIGIGLVFAGWRADVLNVLKTVDSGAKSKISLPAVNGVVSETAVPPLYGEAAGKPSGEAPDFFVECRLEKERARGQRVEYLREVINNNNSTGEIRQKAQEHLITISRNMEKEVDLENLIRAKGFKDAAAMVDDRAVTVIIASNSLTREETAYLKDLISKETGIESQNIVIVPKS